MSGFHDVRFPLALALGASGGPQRKVEIVTLASGREARNAAWAHARRRYDAGGAVRTIDDLHDLIAFFEARRGPLYGFRFQDFSDWRSGPPSRAPHPLDQGIATGDGARRTFQLVKRYGETVRPITKPQAGSVRVAVAGAESPASAFSIDPNAGRLTFTAAPAAGAEISAGFAFDTPVRFDTDRIEASLDGFGAGRALSVPLIEVFA